MMSEPSSEGSDPSPAPTVCGIQAPRCLTLTIAKVYSQQYTVAAPMTQWASSLKDEGCLLCGAELTRVHVGGVVTSMNRSYDERHNTVVQ